MHILESLYGVILSVHIVVCIFMTITILLQAGKGADIGATFGAGSSQTLFGARGAASFLSKVTTVSAILFLMTSLSLAAVHKSRSHSEIKPSVIQVTDEKKTEAQSEEKAEEKK